jgi:hypothetical protein
MKTEPTTLTRREALFSAIKGSIATAVVVPVIVQAVPDESAKVEVPFVPENDYPFFGYEPDPVP